MRTPMRRRLSPGPPALVRTLPRVFAVRLALAVTALSLLLAPAADASVSREQALRIAIAVPAVERAVENLSPVEAAAKVQGDVYVVRLGSHDEVRAEVHVDVLSGHVERVYTGYQADFPLARGAD